MLTYTVRRRRIKVARPPRGSMSTDEPIATIDLRRLSVRMMDGIEATPDEIKEIEGAAQELRAAGTAKYAATLGYIETTNKAVEYYVTKATDLDKQLISGTVRMASKAIRKAMPPKPQAAPAETKSQAPVTPEMLAEALYQALGATASSSKYKLQGPPRSGRQTEIRGFWNLTEVARNLLSRT
ncbi:MAG: hypothetical protein EPO10_07255 [Reyranella sp.]|uniref:hypothetical protein n=1 Tax=Reyranella sp. TaxID=1929291 RepID=UPI0012233D1E|nr:hypothetical protein [Reyranella sp.]TAJ92123.1 MAG: hypothetical protein EPO41_14535 [Reyranella sp.]TBR29568.1 MAG: hypothetical protein EPO10_07255 [Reyranella sp.]